MTMSFEGSSISRYWYACQDMNEILSGDTAIDQAEGTIICHEGSPAEIETITFEWQDKDHFGLDGVLFSREQ